MDYLIIDYDNEIVIDGFYTEEQAYNYLHNYFTPGFIRENELKIIHRSEYEEKE